MIKNDKDDKGKIRASLPLDYFPRAILAVAQVCEDAIHEYGENTWAGYENALQRYKDADIRHKLAMAGGEEYDRKSGLPHTWHRAWNCLAIAELEIREAEKDA